jgi:hypothetical protein
VDAAGGTVLIVNRSSVPDGKLASRITGLFDPKLGTHRPLSGPTFFKEYAASGATPVHYLICDANGCYDAVPPSAATPGGAANGEVVITWALYSTDYLTMTGRPLRASSIQRLGQADYYQPTNLFYPHYLITNRYTGDDNLGIAFGPGLLNVSTSQIRGEVFEVRGDVYFNTVNYPNGYTSFPGKPNGPGLYARGDGSASYPNVNVLYPQNANTSAIVWMAPRESWVYSGAASFQLQPIKRSIGTISNSGTNSFILEQPSFSDRPY